MYFKLIIFSNRGTNDFPIWEVYGMESEFVVTSIGTYDNMAEAAEFAHNYNYILPVMRGDSNSYEVLLTLRKLMK